MGVFEQARLFETTTDGENNGIRSPYNGIWIEMCRLDI